MASADSLVYFPQHIVGFLRGKIAEQGQCKAFLVELIIFYEKKKMIFVLFSLLLVCFGIVCLSLNNV